MTQLIGKFRLLLSDHWRGHHRNWPLANATPLVIAHDCPKGGWWREQDCTRLLIVHNCQPNCIYGIELKKMDQKKHLLLILSGYKQDATAPSELETGPALIFILFLLWITYSGIWGLIFNLKFLKVLLFWRWEGRGCQRRELFWDVRTKAERWLPHWMIAKAVHSLWPSQWPPPNPPASPVPGSLCHVENPPQTPNSKGWWTNKWPAT